MSIFRRSIVPPSASTGFSRCSIRSGSPMAAQTYPPYNIERTGEDAYRISMAVAGFADEDLFIEAHRNVLTVKGERKEEGAKDGAELLYRGIAGRAFERRFQLADHVEVTGAQLKNGLLHIDLKRNIPEEMKPRKIDDRQGRRRRRQADRDAGRRLVAGSPSRPYGAAPSRRRFHFRAFRRGAHRSDRPLRPTWRSSRRSGKGIRRPRSPAGTLAGPPRDRRRRRRSAAARTPLRA